MANQYSGDAPPLAEPAQPTTGPIIRRIRLSGCAKRVRYERDPIRPEGSPHGAGAAMVEGKMQDDATWKQAKVLLDLAKQVAAKDPQMAKRYGL